VAASRIVIVAAVAFSVVGACGAGDDSSTGTPATDPLEAPVTGSDTTTTSALVSTSTTTTTTTTTTSSTTSTTSTTTSTTTTTVPPARESARYRVTVVLEWSPATHPATLPPGWHTSPPVVAAHQTPGNLVPVDSIASPGIESMAETGKTSLLLDELAVNPAVGGVDTGQRVDGAGTDELEVDVTQSTPLLSLVTMLAPSPDWFVGVADVPLFDDGSWTERVELDVTPWDAGTDSGVEFTSDNVDTQPRQAISGPRDSTYVAASNEGRFGYVVIERIG
jgi:hypothetical protein